MEYNSQYHYRSGSTKQQLRGNVLTSFLMEKTGYKWDNAIITNITYEDLDKESFDIFRREALRSGRMTAEELDISNKELLEKLDLIENDKLKRAAALCFYHNPEKVVSGCYARIGKFESSEIMYQDEVHGSLLNIADKVIELIYLKYLKAAISYYKETRVETYPFSRDAIREAVFNAIIHSNWMDNTPIQIRIEDEVMYVSNSSMLPFTWTAETLLGSHKSKPFNPNVARVFYRAGYIESWGRGIQKICEACQKHGTDNPEYIVHSEDIMVKFKALESAIIKDTKPIYINTELNKEEGIDSHDKVLNILLMNPNITLKQLASISGISLRNIQRISKDLQEKGIVTRLGSTRSSYWKINK